MSLYLGTTPIAVNSVSRNIGEIIQSTIPLNDAGLHLLDGSVISGSGSYSAFVTHIAELVSGHQELFTTEANWQQSVTDYGVCGKFVYDSTNNTVRLPKITGFTESTTDVMALGNLVQAGLPNITGKAALQNDRWQNLTGSFVSIDNVTRYTVGLSSGGNGTKTVEFDASRSNSIYGNSTTVQPQAIKVLYYIVIATSTKTQIEVDIDEIVTDLNGKADVDLSNCTKPHIVETYVNGTEWYRVYSDGWCEQGGYVTPTATTTTINLYKAYDNTNYTILSGASCVSNSNLYSPTMGVSKTTSSFSIYTNSTSYRYWWEAKGYTR